MGGWRAPSRENGHPWGSNPGPRPQRCDGWTQRGVLFPTLGRPNVWVVPTLHAPSHVGTLRPYVTKRRPIQCAHFARFGQRRSPHAPAHCALLAQTPAWLPCSRSPAFPPPPPPPALRAACSPAHAFFSRTLLPPSHAALCSPVPPRPAGSRSVMCCALHSLWWAATPFGRQVSYHYAIRALVRIRVARGRCSRAKSQRWDVSPQRWAARSQRSDLSMWGQPSVVEESQHCVLYPNVVQCDP